MGKPGLQLHYQFAGKINDLKTLFFSGDVDGYFRANASLQRKHNNPTVVVLSTGHQSTKNRDSSGKIDLIGEKTTSLYLKG
jgi:hypothetical protein